MTNQLRNWLAHHNTMQVAQHNAGRVQFDVFVTREGRGIIVQTWLDQPGWEIFVTPCGSNDIKRTLAAATAILGGTT